MKRKSLLISILLIVSMMIVSACSEDASKNEKDSSNKEDKTTLTIPWPLDIGPLNPHVYLPNQMTAQAMVYESLLEYNDDGTISPKLAESCEISDDKKVYTFHLRKDVKYSDGTVFNADNVLRNFDAVLANKEMHSWMGMVNHIQSVSKKDDYTVQLQLDEPYYPVLYEIAFVRPFRFLGDNGFPENDLTSKTIKSPIGTGPWVLKEYKKDEYAIFEKNENYWGEKPTVDEIKIKIMPDSESISLAFEKGELDLIYGRGIISLDNYEFLKNNDEYRSAVSDPLSTRALLFNSQTELMSDINIRTAIQYAIDKETMVESITHGTEKVADTILATNIPYANIDLEPIKYNLKKAEQLLDKSGWILPKGKAVREKDGKSLELSLIYISTDAVQKPMAEMMQGELAKIGIKLNIEGSDVMVGIDKLQKGEVDINFWRTNGPPNDPQSFVNESITPKSTGLYEAETGLTNKKEIDEKIKKVLVVTDENERAQLYKDILTMLHEQAVFYPISYETNIALYHKNIEKFKPRASEYDIPYADLKVKR